MPDLVGMGAAMTLKLNYYRLLGRSGLRVSPLALGTMTFGADWGWGADQREARRQFDFYAEAGGNFIDTANLYTNGTSERLVGEFAAMERDKFVIATKFALNTQPGDPNAGGNGRKNLITSLEDSLRRLKLDYVDLYWVHAWDALTPVEEWMRALDDQVRLGKVRYLGVSDMPAWKVSQAATLAQLRGWAPLIALQIEYSLVERSAERELLPMAHELGLGVTPWSPLAQGVLTGKYSAADLNSAPTAHADKEGRYGRNVANGRLNPRSLSIANEAKAIAAELGVSTAQVAIAWLLAREPSGVPILGARTLEQLRDTTDALAVSLSPTQRERLDRISRIELGFPHDFLANPNVQAMLNGGAVLHKI
jgi:aryl-alcohol dehydrogenase-like predicted oxidoreductase